MRGVREQVRTESWASGEQLQVLLLVPCATQLEHVNEARCGAPKRLLHLVESID